mmetsp:Transcript_20675/g.30689  ORF Transcript_20675/g.30689 Transcript_20675/m.30689 type:complete len:99 (+) Transcript_20675:180-476(+)
MFLVWNDNSICIELRRFLVVTLGIPTFMVWSLVLRDFLTQHRDVVAWIKRHDRNVLDDYASVGFSDAAPPTLEIVTLFSSTTVLPPPSWFAQRCFELA